MLGLWVAHDRKSTLNQFAHTGKLLAPVKVKGKAGSSASGLLSLSGPLSSAWCNLQACSPPYVAQKLPKALQCASPKKRVLTNNFSLECLGHVSMHAPTVARRIGHEGMGQTRVMRLVVQLRCRVSPSQVYPGMRERFPKESQGCYQRKQPLSVAGIKSLPIHLLLLHSSSHFVLQKVNAQ